MAGATNGAGAGPPPIPPEAIERFRQLPPELQAAIGRLPVPVAVQLLGLPPDQMLAVMSRLGGGGGGGAGPAAPPRPPGAPGMPRPPGPGGAMGVTPQLIPSQARGMPATPEQLVAQRMARVGLVPARR